MIRSQVLSVGVISDIRMQFNGQMAVGPRAETSCPPVRRLKVWSGARRKAGR